MMLFATALALLGLCRATPIALKPRVDDLITKNCPLYLFPNDYEFPHLIVPISAASPNAVIGNTYTPTISPNDIATIFNFNIPVSRAHQHCTLYFSLPTQAQLVTSSLSFSGAGNFDFTMYQYDQSATSDTTWASQPQPASHQIEVTGIIPGTSHNVWNGDCGIGGLMSWRMRSTDTCLWLFQDWNECAIGAYIVYG